ncbi:sugar phosphate isomerase/epimerase [bacterium]|nr:sugar phosphate isomerase/epimerase [bacterium]
MKKRKVGVMIESFRLGVRGGILKAAEIGADGFQIYVTKGEMAPENMDRSARQAFKQFVADQGLVISALCADYGRGFLDASRNEEKVEKSKRCVDLAVDLGTNVVTTHIGKLPEDKNDPAYRACKQAVTELARYGESKGVYFATETGPESPAHLKEFLDGIPAEGIRANYDPANLAMFDFDQLGGVKILKDYIVHTHAKDGLRGEIVEVPLGEGAVDFPKYITLLDEIGYDGFLTIEREVGEDPVKDIIQAVKFLRSL